MKKNMTYIFLAAWLFFTAACSDLETHETGSPEAPLVLTVVAKTQEDTRAMVEGDVMPDGVTLGITLDDDKGFYRSKGYINLPFADDVTELGQRWHSAEEVNLQNQTARVRAYYPYKEGVDISAIPVEAYSGTDYMYGSSRRDVSCYNSEAEVELGHVLTRIRIKFSLDTYQEWTCWITW